VTSHPDPHVRPATPDDAAAIAPLLTELGYPASAEDVARRLDALAGEDATGVWLAELDGRVAGLVAIHASRLVTRDAPLCRIAAMVVGKAARGRGVGRALMEKVEQEASRWGCDRIEVTSAERRADAHAFYRSLGFEDTSRRFIKELPVL
jgi:GNAT superfamily N-acetyltransferase